MDYTYNEYEGGFGGGPVDDITSTVKVVAERPGFLMMPFMGLAILLIIIGLIVFTAGKRVPGAVLGLLGCAVFYRASGIMKDSATKPL